MGSRCRYQYAPVPSHTNQGGSLVLGLKSALGTLDSSLAHLPRADPVKIFTGKEALAIRLYLSNLYATYD
jgi:hypothetical protein